VHRLDVEDLRRAVGDQLIGHRIVLLEQTPSTNDVVAQMASASAEGLVVFAEEQTAARGQYGRRWESAAGKGLWLSVLLRPRLGVSDSGRLTNFLALSVAAAITERAGLSSVIKWPNDVFVVERKVAGVLVEMRVEPGGEYAAIAGIGLNVNQSFEDFPDSLQGTAGSLAMLAGREFDRTALAIALLREIELGYRALRVAK
jgi:BirA family biotin operon repressor/biotin-[acetyl-CoA-carboxylase] ligase